MHKHESRGKHQDQHPQRITVKALYPERPMSARACMFNQISTGIGAEIACWGNHCHIIAAWASLPEQAQVNHFIICRAIQVKAQSHVGLWNHLSALIQAQVQSRSQVLGPLNRTTRHPFALFLSIFSKKWTKWCELQTLCILRSGLEARPLWRSIRLRQNRGDQKPRSSHVGLLCGKSAESTNRLQSTLAAHGQSVLW